MGQYAFVGTGSGYGALGKKEILQSIMGTQQKIRIWLIVCDIEIETGCFGSINALKRPVFFNEKAGI